MFKIHAICLVKDEADIIAQTLESALEWCNYIYVLDNGSTDGTWEKVIHLSTKFPSIIPYKQDFGPYRETLRGTAFYTYKSNASENDWWCYLDADEIYIDNPRMFLANVSKDYQVIYGAHFTYYFTEKDLERYNQDSTFYADDAPIDQKCRWYLNDWSEPRFFRAEKYLTWTYEKPNCGAAYPLRIRIKHFRYRSPQQIQKRLNIRLQCDPKHFLHERGFQSWQDKIVDSSQLYFDAHDGRYVLREDMMPSFNSNKFTLTERMIRFCRMYLKSMYIKFVLRDHIDKVIRSP